MNERVFSGDIARLRSPERRERLQISRVLNYCRSGIDLKSVLDVGSGTGLFAEAFAAEGFRVKGVDLNPDFLKIAQELVPGAEFRVAEAENLPFDKGSFDLVFLGHVLHEADDPARALREAARVCRRRVAVLEWPYIDQQIGPPLDHRISEQRVMQLATDAGFADIDQIRLKLMVLYILDK